MGIKWQDVKLGVSPITNEIYIGKTKRDTKGFEVWIDKSNPKTKEVIRALTEHMAQMLQRNGRNCYIVAEKYQLTFKDLSANVKLCDYCNKIENATPTSPKKNYKFCPMCGRELKGGK